MIRPLCLALTLLTATPALAKFTCPAPPDPIVSLSYGSRYSANDSTHSDIDPAADTEATDALKPIDSFLRDLTSMANDVFEKNAKKAEIADCVVSRIVAWAGADALTDLQTDTAKLTIGSRIAGFGLVLLQVAPFTTQAADLVTIKIWYAGLMDTEMQFWEESAPTGSRQGNLRAWTALAAAAGGQLLGDPVMRGWSAWSVRYMLCKAATDGSLPQEMTRGRLALHYQLHAIAPLVAATLLLDRQGIPLKDACDQALDRIVTFATDDLATGAATLAITGEPQSLFDGSDTLQNFDLAFLEPYFQLSPKARKGPLGDLAKRYAPLNYSKLGGKQALIWKAN